LKKGDETKTKMKVAKRMVMKGEEKNVQISKLETSEIANAGKILTICILESDKSDICIISKIQ
jgi:hypothetical protein